MKFSLKQKAFAHAVGIFILCVVAGIVVATAISKVPVEALPWLAMAGLAGLAINLLYSTRLSQLEYREKLKEMTEKKA